MMFFVVTVSVYYILVSVSYLYQYWPILFYYILNNFISLISM